MMSHSLVVRSIVIFAKIINFISISSIDSTAVLTVVAASKALTKFVIDSTSLAFTATHTHKLVGIAICAKFIDKNENLLVQRDELHTIDASIKYTYGLLFQKFRANQISIRQT